MPGLKALMDRISGARQARWISFYTASFSLGSSGSFLITGAMASAVGWRAAFVLATAAAAAFLLVAFGLPPVKHRSNPFDFGSVLRNRAAMGYVFGYSAHTWELFGARSWMVAFLA
jgi:predicted MFS family arabinose efflux permease